MPLLHIRDDQLQTVQNWLQRKGPWPVTIGRLIPSLVIPVSLLAGVVHIPYRRSFLGVFIANAIWTTLFIAKGIAIQLGINGSGPRVENDLAIFKLSLIMIVTLALLTVSILFFWRPRVATGNRAGFRLDYYETSPAEGGDPRGQ